MLSLLVLLATYTTSQLPHKRPSPDEESASLLKNKSVPVSGQDSRLQPTSGYGSVSVADDTDAYSTDTEDSEAESPADGKAKKKQRPVAERLQKDGNWLTYLKGFSLFIPMIWPSKQPKLYFNMIGCALCLLSGRVLKIAVPNQLGIIVNVLTTGTGSLYKAIALYALFRWAASSSGIEMLRRLLWQPVEQYSYTAITTAAYNQIMELSSDFHNNKQSGELYQSINQGSSINELLETLVFQLVPMVIDISVGFVYLNLLFGPYMSLLAMATTCAYFATATHFNVQQSGIRRKFQDMARKMNQVMFDTVGSWETVAYFNRVPYEENRYKQAVTLYIFTRQLWSRLGMLYTAISNSIVELGLCGALILAAYQVMQGTQTVGNFVLLLTYWSTFTGKTFRTSVTEVLAYPTKTTNREHINHLRGHVVDRSILAASKSIERSFWL